MFKPGMSDKFGFTGNEVKVLLRHHNKTEKADNVKKWYNGYKAANGLRLYNPWSIIEFISSGSLEAHWVNTGQSHVWYLLLSFAYL